MILAFEDLQWADSGLLEFIDYLLEWSADSADLRDRAGPARAAPAPAGLEPAGPGAAVARQRVRASSTALAPGLPDDLVDQIARRAEGIPLYVVETIRMLLDRGLLLQDGARYVVTGDVSDLDVPETLQALVASRLDGLSQAERSLLQDASVLGHSFTAAAAAALSGRPEA